MLQATQRILSNIGETPVWRLNVNWTCEHEGNVETWNPIHINHLFPDAADATHAADAADAANAANAANAADAADAVARTEVWIWSCQFLT